MENQNTAVQRKTNYKDPFPISNESLYKSEEYPSGSIVVNPGLLMMPAANYFTTSDTIEGDENFGYGTFVRKEIDPIELFYSCPKYYTSKITLSFPKVLWRIGKTHLEAYIMDQEEGGLYFRSAEEDRTFSDLNAKRYTPVDVAVWGLKNNTINCIALVMPLMFNSKL